MAIVDSGSLELYYVKEQKDKPGVLPTADTQWRKFDVVSESLVHDREVAQSQSITSSRQVRDLIPTSFAASGSFDVEFEMMTGSSPTSVHELVSRQGSYDDLLEGALCSKFGDLKGESKGLLSETYDVTQGVSGGQTTYSVKAGKDLDLKSGYLLRYYPGGGSDEYFGRVISTNKRGSDLDVVVADVEGLSAFPKTARTEANSRIIASGMRNGDRINTYTIDKFFKGNAAGFRYKGMFVNTFNLSLEGQSSVRASFDFLGIGGETITKAPKLISFNSESSLPTVWRRLLPQQLYITSTIP